MAIINLRDYYPWYTQDAFLEVSEEVAAELAACKRYEQTHERYIRLNKVNSLDTDSGTETADICYNDCPERVFDLMEQHCRLCYALNSLPETQGRRIDAHYLLGMSQRKIAKAEDVNERNVRHSISKGLARMKKLLKLF
jgi:RNA polymerase sigma-70 factor (ECF subfamily)